VILALGHADARLHLDDATLLIVAVHCWRIVVELDTLVAVHHQLAREPVVSTVLLLLLLLLVVDTRLRWLFASAALALASCWLIISISVTTTPLIVDLIANDELVRAREGTRLLDCVLYNLCMHITEGQF
jgi:hypothetical protein